VPLGKLIELKRGYDLPSRLRGQGIVPVVSSSGVSGYHAQYKVEAPGVVTGRYGTLGKVYKLDKPFWPLNTTLYVRDFKGNDPDFIYYLLKSIDFLKYSDKAAVPGVNRNHLHTAEVLAPPLDEQRAIAHILGALDDKIERNRQMNHTLERIAQALFKSWFVDFDPVVAKAAGIKPFGMSDEVVALFPDRFVDSKLGLIPEGWNIVTINDMAQYINGKNFTKNSTGSGKLVIRIAELNSGPSASTIYNETNADDKNIAYPGDLLFSWSGSLNVYRWYRDEALINQHIFKVVPNGYPQWFVHLTLIDAMPFFQGIASDKATTMGHIKREHLTQWKVVLPGLELITAADELVSPLYNLTLKNERESLHLAETRDILMPKLLSGEIRVEDPQKLIQEDS